MGRIVDVLIERMFPKAEEIQEPVYSQTRLFEFIAG